VERWSVLSEDFRPGIRVDGGKRRIRRFHIRAARFGTNHPGRHRTTRRTYRRVGKGRRTVVTYSRANVSSNYFYENGRPPGRRKRPTLVRIQ